MHEDKLSQDQRLRLEALAQAINSTGAPVGKAASTNQIIARIRGEI